MTIEADVSTFVRLNDLTAMTQDVADEVDLVWQRVVATSSFIGGELVERFEDEWARYCGTGGAVGVGNGTDAIELTLRALGIGAGDDVLVPTNTFVATAEAVVLAGATPRFVDVDPVTLLVTEELLEAASTPRTAAAIVVHLYGNIPPMAGICSWARSRQIALIEDAAQAHGASLNGQRAGSFGIAGCFSFYPGKNLGAFGDAGAIVTSDEGLASKLRAMANHGRAGSHHSHSVLGMNSRLDGLQAGVLSAKLRKLDMWNAARRDAMSTYRAGLADDAGHMLEVDCESSFYQNVVRIPRRDQVQLSLRQAGIETGVYYPVPCHRLGPFQQYADRPLPVAEATANEILSLPLFPHITDAAVEHVCRQLKGALREVRHVA